VPLSFSGSQTPREESEKRTQARVYAERHTCPISLLSGDILAAFRPWCTAPTWKKRIIVWTGTLLAQRCRSITTALRQSSHERETTFSTLHQMLKRVGGNPSDTHCECGNVCPRRQQGRIAENCGAGTAVGREHDCGRARYRCTRKVERFGTRMDHSGCDHDASLDQTLPGLACCVR
jgi:hypothetical protein